MTNERFNKWWASGAYELVVSGYGHIGNENSYHNINHLIDCWNVVSNYFPYSIVTDEVKFSLIYHDLVYVVGAKDNEELSAALAVIDLSGIYQDEPDKLKKIASLILSTKHTVIETEDLETQIILDTDLSILGSSPEKYKRYSEQIYDEWSTAVDENSYKMGRINFLANMLKRDRIFYRLTQLEKQARTNILNEILHLSRVV